MGPTGPKGDPGAPGAPGTPGPPGTANVLYSKWIKLSSASPFRTVNTPVGGYTSCSSRYFISADLFNYINSAIILAYLKDVISSSIVSVPSPAPNEFSDDFRLEIYYSGFELNIHEKQSNNNNSCTNVFSYFDK